MTRLSSNGQVVRLDCISNLSMFCKETHACTEPGRSICVPYYNNRQITWGIPIITASSTANLSHSRGNGNPALKNGTPIKEFGDDMRSGYRIDDKIEGGQQQQVETYCNASLQKYIDLVRVNQVKSITHSTFIAKYNVLSPLFTRKRAGCPFCNLSITFL